MSLDRDRCPVQLCRNGGCWYKRWMKFSEMHLNIVLLAAFMFIGTAHAAQDPGASAPSRPSIPDVKLSPYFGGHTFMRPVQAVMAPGDDTTVFVLEQPGRVLALRNQEAKSEPKVFMDIRDAVHDKNNEEGLLSLAFHPEYATNGRLYVYYSAKRPRRGVLSEFTVNSERTAVDPESERVLLEVGQPWGNHNGSTVLFGPDGMLYVSYGDGGAANDPNNAGQDLSTLLGTIVRIDVDRKDDGLEYAVPKDNPFVGVDGARPEIWAYGLRNVWRMSFDRGTGTLWAGDVGQNAWEEIDIITRGGNYGWKPREGLVPFKLYRGEVDPEASFIDPVTVYPRDKGISVTGGYVQRGHAQPEMEGVYFYADYGSGRIWGLRYDGESVTEEREVFQKSGYFISSFGELSDGRLLVCVFRNTFTGKGKVFLMEPAVATQD